jgi:hypothetical protein
MADEAFEKVQQQMKSALAGDSHGPSAEKDAATRDEPIARGSAENQQPASEGSENGRLNELGAVHQFEPFETRSRIAVRTRETQTVGGQLRLDGP